MQRLRLLPREKSYLRMANRRSSDEDENAFSFLERDATKNYHGRKIKTLGYPQSAEIQRQKW